MATCEPLNELEWFCPHCGVLRVRLRCEADSYATNVIDEDGCCAFCGYTCCSMSEVRALLSAHGLHIVSEADRKLLDAMAALPTAAVRTYEGTFSNEKHRYEIDAQMYALWQAELARRSGT